MNQTAPTQSGYSMDLDEIKLKQQSTWGAGDYAQVGATLQIVGETLAEDLDLHAEQSVLDVAAGNGNFSLAAARRSTRVTSTDFVAELLEKGKIRSIAEGFEINFQQADAENLPFSDGSFDVVGSTFGVMFTPNQSQSASELVRVCRAGGKIGLANWTPGGFIGQVFQTIGRFLPNPLPSPALWGVPSHLEKIFAHQVSDINIEVRNYQFKYASTEEWLKNFKQVYGPMRNTFLALSDTEQSALQADLMALLDASNVAVDGTMAVPSEYVRVLITK